jgi:hypothetical protein
MSNYTKTVNFATKDNLSPGNPLKIVKGTEIDTEYNNIATAVATKTDNSAAAITGGSITGITDLAVADGGTGASTAAGALNNLLPSQTSAANKYLQSDGTNASWDAVSLSTADITGTLPVLNGGTGVTTSTGTTNVVLSNSPTLVTPALGTPSAAVLTNATGLPISTGVSGLGTNVATLLATPSSANLASAITDETGSGSLVFATSPTLVTPILGTPTSGTLTNATGLPISTGVSGLGTGVATFLATPSSANLISAVTDETGTGSLVFATSPTLVTPALGTPSALVGTNITGTASGLTAGNVTTNANLTGAITSTGNATSLGSFSSANLLSALTDETGTGVVVFATSPTLVTPILGTPTSATLTNATGLPLSTGVTGNLPVTNLNSGTSASATTFWRGDGSWATPAGGGGGGVSYTAVKTANYTAANNDGVLTDTTAGAFTVTLPTSPSVGNIVLVIDSLSQWGTNNLTIDPTGSIKIAGNTAGDTLVCDITGATVTLVYTGATYGWNVAAQVGGNGGTAVTLDGTQTLTNKTLTAPTLTAPVLGTPASGTVTNLTGTASININGTVGATTPTAGNFTTLGATGVATFSAGTAALPALTKSGDTNTGVFFPSGDEIAASTGGTERLRINTTGNVGIGETSPTTAKLHVVGSGTANSIMTSTVTRFSGSANGFNMGDDGTDAVIGVTNSSSNLGFLSRVAGVYTKTMVLTSAGYLLLGYTTSNGSYNLQVNSQIFATSGTIATSDGRYKEDVIPLSGALSLVNALNPVQFKWKKHPIHNFDRQQPTVGFIAQEVQQVLVDKPYLNSIIKRNECTIPEEKDANGNVTKEAYVEEFLGIAEGNMIAILTKAIQEQQALITSLTERITALEGV